MLSLRQPSLLLLLGWPHLRLYCSNVARFWSQVGPMLVPKAVYRSGGPKAQTQFATTCRWAFERKQRQLAIPNAIPNFAKTMTDVAMAHEMNDTVLAQQDMEDAVESSRCASQALAPGVPAIFVAQCIPRGVHRPPRAMSQATSGHPLAVLFEGDHPEQTAHPSLKDRSSLTHPWQCSRGVVRLESNAPLPVQPLFAAQV